MVGIVLLICIVGAILFFLTEGKLSAFGMWASIAALLALCIQWGTRGIDLGQPDRYWVIVACVLLAVIVFVLLDRRYRGKPGA